MGPEPYFCTNESNFKAFQNLVSEHSVAGVPASLYYLTKSVPDPLYEIAEKVILINPFRPSHKKLPYTALFSRNMKLINKRTYYSITVSQFQQTQYPNYPFFFFAPNSLREISHF